ILLLVWGFLKALKAITDGQTPVCKATSGSQLTDGKEKQKRKCRTPYYVPEKIRKAASKTFADKV
ncbi:hypothetical protein NL529_29725, partial [Klebsiella pneumoniae]|nr:hypothetical protein [Klebsiella pneumoniae]